MNSILKQFINPDQLTVMLQNAYGEEAQWFQAKLVYLHQLIRNMPGTYEQSHLDKEAVAYLHYFKGSYDAYITEKDTGEGGQHQAFGWADFGDGGELGYISIVELLENGVELDLHWTPKRLSEVLK